MSSLPQIINLLLNYKYINKIKIAATGTWKKLPSKGEIFLDLSSIPQGPKESFQDFVAHLLQASGRIISDRGFENVNKGCKEALGAHQRWATLAEVLQIRADSGPSHVQGANLAAAITHS